MGGSEAKGLGFVRELSQKGDGCRIVLPVPTARCSTEQKQFLDKRQTVSAIRNSIAHPSFGLSCDSAIMERTNLHVNAKRIHLWFY